jgi:hypothetical protein
MSDNSNLFKKKTQIKQIKKHTKTNFCVRQFPFFFVASVRDKNHQYFLGVIVSLPTESVIVEHAVVLASDLSIVTL